MIRILFKATHCKSSIHSLNIQHLAVFCEKQIPHSESLSKTIGVLNTHNTVQLWGELEVKILAGGLIKLLQREILCFFLLRSFLAGTVPTTKQTPVIVLCAW